MKDRGSNLRSVMQIIRESLREASKIRLPKAPPIYMEASWNEYLDKCQVLRRELGFIRDRASKAMAMEYGNASEYVKELNSFFVTESISQQLEAEHNAFVKLLTSILDVLRLPKRLGESDESSVDIHANILLLVQRMDTALDRGDDAGVLHASASIFETMAKDIVGIETVQDKTMASFFDRYRQDSRLPDEVLDYVLAIYKSRNVTPLAGHGSTQSPHISRETSITLVEMTKAFVKIEYRLRENKPKAA